MVRRSKKGDPKAILKFLDSHEPLSDEDAEAILEAVEKGRKRTLPRKINFE
jgi:hypothetical protein